MKTLVMAIAIVCVCAQSVADEADQYLSWGVELEDASPAINAFINKKIRSVLEDANTDPLRTYDCAALVDEIFRAIYLDRLRAELTWYAESSENIDVFPPRERSLSEVKNMSIYRDTSFPNMIRVTRTIRVGDVYMGIDKLAHFFGFGRRYYLKYQDHHKLERSSDEALDLTIRWGVFTENTVLGKGVNGIFSLADLEANYRGLLMARDFCEGDDPYLRKNGERWELTREVHFEDYVNPLFDESFNPSIYTEDLNKAVLPSLVNFYAGRTELPNLVERFRKYKAKPIRSRSMNVIRQYFIDEGHDFQRARKLTALSLAPNDPAAPLDPSRAVPEGETLP